MRRILLPCTSLQLKKVWPRILELWDVCFLHVQPASTQHGHWHIHSLTLQFLAFSQSLVDLQVLGHCHVTGPSTASNLIFFYFFLGGGGFTEGVPSDPQQSSLWILRCSCNQVQQQTIPTPWRIISSDRKDIIPEVLVQESWSGWPSCFYFSVTPPMRYSPSCTGMHSHSNSTAGACCGFPDDIWEIFESSCIISLLLERTGLDGQQFFWTSTTCSLFSRLERLISNFFEIFSNPLQHW